MLRDTEQAAGASDRERRERLEAVQVELREARQAVAHVDDAVARRLTEAQAALDAAKARKEAAQARAKALEEAARAGAERVKTLEEELAEARVLAEGAKRRGYVEWASPGSYKEGAVTLGLTAMVVSLVAAWQVSPDSLPLFASATLAWLASWLWLRRKTK